MDTAFIIPAVKKNVAFYDDLMKKMVGDPLIQRAIKKAEAITEKKNIYITLELRKKFFNFLKCNCFNSIRH